MIARTRLFLLSANISNNQRRLVKKCSVFDTGGDKKTAFCSTDYTTMACNENSSVDQYREQYMRSEDIPGIDLDGICQPKDLLTKVRHICSVNKFEPLLVRTFKPLNEGAVAPDRKTIRILQWNILAQALSTGKDNFVRCPPEALEWQMRKVRILEEILRIQPDVICLQEVDHYGFFATFLQKVGYQGCFFPKPDSPALYTENTNGPDGCAMFFKTSQLELIKLDPVVLRADGNLSNQVCIISYLKKKKVACEFLVATTHLKAKHGWEDLRHKQGSWLLSYLETTYKNIPMIITGDLNADCSEPVYGAFKQSGLNLCSTYALTSNNQETEPPYTTFKIRGTKEGSEAVSCRTIDYMWFSRNKLDAVRLLSIPTGAEIGPDRMPSFQYPSDHFALAADYVLK